MTNLPKQPSDQRAQIKFYFQPRSFLPHIGVIGIPILKKTMIVIHVYAFQCLIECYLVLLSKLIMCR